MTRGRAYDLVVFDWDGTLFDSTAAITRSIQAAVTDVGGRTPTREQASWVIGLGLRQALAHAAPDVPAERYPELAQRYQHHFGRELNDLHFFDGVETLLHDLRRRGYKLAVATGKSRRGLNEILEGRSIRSWFDATRTADETASKPDPQMLHELMWELDVPPERTMMIGDTSHDLCMAHRASCAPVAVAYGAHQPEHWNDCPPVFVAPSVPQLHEWIVQHG